MRRVKARGAASQTRFRDRGRVAGRRMGKLGQTLRRRSGEAMAEVQRVTAELAGLARQTLGQVQPVWRNARRALRRRPQDGRLARLVGELDETMTHIQRLLAQTRQRLQGERVIPDRLVSLADPDARPIRKGKPKRPTEFGYTALVAEDERGFVADTRSSWATPGRAAACARGQAGCAGDRPGAGSVAGDRELAALGVARIGGSARAP